MHISRKLNWQQVTGTSICSEILATRPSTATRRWNMAGALICDVMLELSARF